MEEKELFLDQGYVGPYKSSLTKTFFLELNAKITKIIDERKSHPSYGRFSVRDWHLVYPEIVELFKDKEVIDRLQSILGPDLILWRSKFFDKIPGEGPIGWHQEWGKFNGEEIGNNIPALEKPLNPEGFVKNVTVWFALTDVVPTMGVLRFAKGTHTKRFPIEMVELTKSEFWQNPTILERKPSEIIKLAQENALVLDIDTSQIFQESEKDKLSIEQIKLRLKEAMQKFHGAKTVSFNEQEHSIANLEMKTGEFVIFTERTMHGSGPNTSEKRRLGFNGRITTSDSLIYPGRLSSQFIDGSNLDISNHKNILLSGKSLNDQNVF